MTQRVFFAGWSIEPADKWIARFKKDDSQNEYLELVPLSEDASLRLTPDDRNYDADKWVETVATANRRMGRSVAAVQVGTLSGCITSFAAAGEHLRGWALTAESRPLDACYRCLQHVAGRDDEVVDAMLDTLRRERGASPAAK